MRGAAAFAVVTLAAGLSGCAARQPVASPKTGKTGILESRVGVASYYGKEFHGKVTASGARFNMNAMVAAHPSYPFGTLLRVTNLANGRSATVRVVDRGPGPEQRADGLILDVSRRAAEVLGFIERGRTRVRLDVLAWGG